MMFLGIVLFAIVVFAFGFSPAIGVVAAILLLALLVGRLLE